MGIDNSLAVDGIEHVIRVLEEIENNKLGDLDFFEGLSCTGGCVGGPLVFEYSYVAKTRIRKLMERLDKARPEQRPSDLNELPIYFDEPIKPKNVMQLDENINEALRKIDQIDKLERALPGLDCGSCGSPTCRALAEDIVMGNSRELDCVFRLKEARAHAGSADGGTVRRQVLTDSVKWYASGIWLRVFNTSRYFICLKRVSGGKKSEAVSR